MVAGAGCDFRFGNIGPLDDVHRVAGDRQRVGNRVDDDGADGQLGAQLARQRAQGFGIMRPAMDSQHFGDFIGLLFVETEDDLKVFFELNDQSQGARDVVGGALLRVAQVEEDKAPGHPQAGAEFLLERLPDVAHVREHGPIHERHQVGVPKFFGKPIAAETGEDVCPGDFLERGMFAEHDFAVLKFQRVGVAGFGDGMDFGPLDELVENGVDVRIAQVAEVGHLESKTRQGVGHDRAIAAEFSELVHQLDIGAFTGGFGEPFRQAGDGRDPFIILRIHALVHRMEDFVNKPVQPDKRGQMRRALSQGQQFLRAQLSKLDGARHENLKPLATGRE